MSVLLGAGVITTITFLYLGRKGWLALHKLAGITPGTLVYKDPNAPLSLPNMRWRQLSLNLQHLRGLADAQLRQLQRIDDKVATYQDYQQALHQQNITSTVSELEFVTHKLVHTRLPEMLASHHHLWVTAAHKNAAILGDDKRLEANQLLQESLDNIEQRLDSLLNKIETQHLHELRAIRRYLDSHDTP